MTKAQHTPGPWSIDSNDAQWITADCDGLVVAEIPYGEGNEGDRHHEVNDANAQIIAAAPDLLEALEKLRKRPTASQALIIINDAIAKARGE